MERVSVIEEEIFFFFLQDQAPERMWSECPALDGVFAKAIF